MPGAGRFPRHATVFPRSLVASHGPFTPPEIVLAALRPLGKAVLGKAEGKFVQYVVLYAQSNASFAGKLKPFSTNLTTTFCFELGK